MGLAPGFFDYEAGSVCPHCHATLFNGRTPMYVELELADLVKCPLAVYPPPNGVWLLPQVLPCEWYYECIPYRFHWILGDTVSFINVWSIPIRPYFYSQVLNWCLDGFANETAPCGGASQAVGGTAKLRWGPTIGPQSSFIQWEVGNPCCICQNKIFSGFTPRWVEANVSGIETCPAVPGTRPVGTFLLEQISACSWQLILPDYIFTWTLANATSTFEILENPGGRVWFTRTTPKVCWTFFFGQLIFACNDLNVWGYEGEVQVSWGPWIVP